MPSVLYLVHGLPPEEHTGTPLATYAYATGMARRGWNVGVAYASAGRSVTRSVDGEGIERFPMEPSQPNGLLWAIEAAARPFGTDSPEVGAFESILDTFGPDVVHVVDNVTMPLEWPEAAHARGIPVVRTVSAAEDLCGLIGPVSPHSAPVGYCEAPITPEHCAGCVASVFTERWGRAVWAEARTAAPQHRLREQLLDSRNARLVATMRRKRERARRQFDEVFDRVVFATPAWRDYFVATLPVEDDKVRVVEMGMDVSSWPPSRHRRRRRSGEPAVLAWATTLGAARGIGHVIEAFSSPALATRSDYRLRVHGGGDPELVAPLLKANEQVELVGRYAAEDLPDILGDSDIGLCTSLFETFHRVPREYLLAGLPVVANPTFGVVDLIRHGENGLVYDHREPQQLVDAVTALLDDPALQDKLAEGASSTPVRSVDEEVDELAALYQSLS